MEVEVKPTMMGKAVVAVSNVGRGIEEATVVTFELNKIMVVEMKVILFMAKNLFFAFWCNFSLIIEYVFC